MKHEEMSFLLHRRVSDIFEQISAPVYLNPASSPFVMAIRKFRDKYGIFLFELNTESDFLSSPESWQEIPPASELLILAKTSFKLDVINDPSLYCDALIRKVVPDTPPCLLLLQKIHPSDPYFLDNCYLVHKSGHFSVARIAIERQFNIDLVTSSPLPNGVHH